MKKWCSIILGGLPALVLTMGVSFAESLLPEVHGFVSGAYLWNINDPQNGQNGGRIFDTEHNTFSLDVAEIVFMNEATEEGRVGYRFDVDYGNIATFTSSAADFRDTDGDGTADTLFTSNLDDVDLQQAYVSYLAPIGNGLSIDFGKFVTTAGAEVIEGHDGYNWNYSRSFLFGLAIPFTHTGLRLGYDLSEMISLTALVVNGWDVVHDNNHDKTFGASLGVAPIDGVSVALNWIGGPEKDGNNGDQRHIIDVVATVDLIDNMSFMLNYDYGWEEDLVGTTDANWKGVAAYARYDASDWVEGFALNLRGEFFDDNSTPGADRNGFEVWEITLTPEWTLGEHLVVRPEYRHDEQVGDVADSPYQDGNGNPTSRQDTIALNMLYAF